jgi:hypothetical protein
MVRRLAVGCSAWLGSVLCIRLENLRPVSRYTNDEVLLYVNHLLFSGMPMVAAVEPTRRLGDYLELVAGEPPQHADRLRTNVKNLVVRWRWKELRRLHIARELHFENVSAVDAKQSCVSPIVTALEAEGDIMAIGAPECGGIAGPPRL